MTGMSLGPIVLTAIVTTLIALLFNGAAWFIFRRQIEKQDSTIQRLFTEVSDLRERRMASFEEKLKEYVPHSEFAASHAMFEKRLDQGTANFHDLREDISMIRSSVEGLTREVKLVLASMKLSMRSLK